MARLASVGVALVALAACRSTRTEAGGGITMAIPMPEGWHVVRTSTVADESLPAAARALGCRSAPAFDYAPEPGPQDPTYHVVLCYMPNAGTAFELGQRWPHAPGGIGVAHERFYAAITPARPDAPPPGLFARALDRSLPSMR